ncbi:MAG: hypothetical protein ACOYNF_01615 [Rhodoferax sp.]
MTDLAYAVTVSALVAEQSAQEITIQYRLSNQSQTRVFAFDRVLYFDQKGQTKNAETDAYIFLEGQSIARLVRGIINPPMYMSVSRRPPIVVTPIEAGQSAIGTIKLPLPFSEMNPYFPRQTCDGKVVKPIVILRLQIGWVEQRQNMTFAKVTIDGTEMIRLQGGGGSPLQRVAQTEISVGRVALCPYIGKFYSALLAQ